MVREERWAAPCICPPFRTETRGRHIQSTQHNPTAHFLPPVISHLTVTTTIGNSIKSITSLHHIPSALRSSHSLLSSSVNHNAILKAHHTHCSLPDAGYPYQLSLRPSHPFTHSTSSSHHETYSDPQKPARASVLPCRSCTSIPCQPSWNEFHILA